jgi:hypothetical protein
MIDKTGLEKYNKDPQSNKDSIPFWQTTLRQETKSETIVGRILPGFDYENLWGAYPNTKTVVSDN